MIRTRTRALSPRWALAALSLAAALGSASCGEATGLLLTIESSYRVPGEVDALMVRIQSEVYAERLQQIPLSGPFPHTLIVEVNGPETVTVTLHAMRQDRIVTSAHLEATVTWGRLKPYTLSL